jgi:hypothetical protein
MVQGIFARLFVLATGKVDIEEILPGFALKRPRLDLGQVDIPEGKNSHTFEEGAGHILYGKDD